MFLNDDQFCRINCYIVRLLSHMPCVSSVMRLTFLSITTVVLVLSFLWQAGLPLEEEVNIIEAFSVVPGTAATLTCLLLLLISYVNKDQHGKLLQDLELQWDQGVSIEEELIKEKSAKITKLIVKVLIPLGTSVLFLPALTPYFLDLILPLNESRPLSLVFPVSHCIDSHRYFFPLLFFQYVTSLVVSTIVGSLMNMSIIIVRSISALFTVIGHHLEYLAPPKKLHQRCGSSIEKQLKNKIKYCALRHQQILEYTALTNYCADWLLFICLVGTTFAFTFSLVELTDPELIDYKNVIFGSVQIGQFVIFSFLGQQMLDSSLRLPGKLYSSRWYACTPKLQKLLLLILLRSREPCAFSTRGMYVFSLKNLGSVLQTMVSYCMVIRQFR